MGFSRVIDCSSSDRPGRSVSPTRHRMPYTRSTLPIHTETLPSGLRAVAQSTGDTVAQLWETGKLNSMPRATHEPRYDTCAFLSAVCA